MRVMVFMKTAEESEPGMAPTPEMLEAFEAMDRFTEELVKAGVFVAAAGLIIKPNAEFKRIVCDGASRTVIDGPFAEARELVVGFSIWAVKDMDEAVGWAMRTPAVPGRDEMEIRPLYEAAISPLTPSPCPARLPKTAVLEGDREQIQRAADRQTRHEAPPRSAASWPRGLKGRAEKSIALPEETRS